MKRCCVPQRVERISEAESAIGSTAALRGQLPQVCILSHPEKTFRLFHHPLPARGPPRSNRQVCDAPIVHYASWACRYGRLVRLPFDSGHAEHFPD
jgi:hypothetical protein